jgi:S-adenosylmethionine-diacylgycerolhomoserine-N-methlytransferase
MKDTTPSNHLLIRSSDHLSDVTSAMNNMYRYTRHVYDATRKYYLLGRDRLIDELNAQPGEVIIEVGCGTARNLIKMAQKYPGVHFYGLDASEEMLKTANESIARAGLSDRITVAHGFAQDFDPNVLFGIPGGAVDKFVFSYSLSMIPPWKESIDHALALLKTTSTDTPPYQGGAGGGQGLYIVDFGGQDGLPAWFRAFLFWWLDLFGVHFRPELPAYLNTLAQNGLKASVTTGLKGYYLLAKIGG